MAGRRKLEENAAVHKITRLQLIEGTPWSLAFVFLPLDLISAEDRTPIAARLEHWLDERYKEESVAADVSVEFIVAHDVEAHALHVVRSAPLFLARWTIYGAARPLEFCRVLYRAEMTRFAVHIQKSL